MNTTNKYQAVANKIALEIKTQVQSNRVKVEAWASKVVSEAGTVSDNAHKILLATREAICADLEAVGIKSSEAIHKAQVGQVEYIGKVVAGKLGLPVGTSWNKSGFKAPAPKAQGKEKGVTGEQVAAGEAMSGTGKALPDVHPTTRLAAIVAELRGMIEQGKLSGVDVELAVSLMVKDCSAPKKSKKAA
jgi:hypothetical protein